jgi:hypothetical protein
MLIYPQSIGVLLSGSWVLLQLLLGPIVSQLLVEPPIEDSSDINMTEWATVQQMDDTLVSCLGQMALTAGTDLLWKPLNHEVINGLGCISTS